MNLIKSFEDLKEYHLTNCSQFWFYVILINPRDMTKAGKTVLDNLNIFHIDSGEDCHYFIPGFVNTGTGLFRELAVALGFSKPTVSIEGFGNLNFDDRNFVEFYKELESRNNSGWRYSGECELLLFNISMGNKIKLNNFASYNLDDITRNSRNISEFIRTTINVGKDASDQAEAKRMIDEKFYEMIMPDRETMLSADYKKGWEFLRKNGFNDNSYYFISYSTKDYRIVSEIRNNLCKSGISCWMAPFDIPSGTNYAWIIEHAIAHAGKFVCMLSENAVESVWVGKELKRAISLFQQTCPEKLCVVWLKKMFPLSGTPLALPLEDIQISISIGGNSENYFMLADEEKQAEIKNRDKIRGYRSQIEEILAPAENISGLKKIVSRMYAIAQHNGLNEEENRKLYDMCGEINRRIDIMMQCGRVYEDEYLKHYTEVMRMIRDLINSYVADIA